MGLWELTGNQRCVAHRKCFQTPPHESNPGEQQIKKWGLAHLFFPHWHTFNRPNGAPGICCPCHCWDHSGKTDKRGLQTVRPGKDSRVSTERQGPRPGVTTRVGTQRSHATTWVWAGQEERVQGRAGDELGRVSSRAEMERMPCPLHPRNHPTSTPKCGLHQPL